MAWALYTTQNQNRKEGYPCCDDTLANIIVSGIIIKYLASTKAVCSGKCIVVYSKWLASLHAHYMLDIFTVIQHDMQDHIDVHIAALLYTDMHQTLPRKLQMCNQHGSSLIKMK